VISGHLPITPEPHSWWGSGVRGENTSRGCRHASRAYALSHWRSSQVMLRRHTEEIQYRWFSSLLRLDGPAYRCQHDMTAGLWRSTIFGEHQVTSGRALKPMPHRRNPSPEATSANQALGRRVSTHGTDSERTCYYEASPVPPPATPNPYLPSVGRQGQGLRPAARSLTSPEKTTSQDRQRPIVMTTPHFAG